MKNKFKKVIAASLAVSVLLAFTGCGNNQAPSADNKKTGICFHGRYRKHG